MTVQSDVGISWKKDGSTAVITMNNGENRHNLDFALSMEEVLASIEEDQAVTAVVITSGDPKFWSTGLDILWVQQILSSGSLEELERFLYTISSVFTRLLTFPTPILASINGHVAGNGLILACACDLRLMRADRGFARFPEVELGIQFLPSMVAIVKQVFPVYLFKDMVFSSRKVTATELAQHHVVDYAPEDEEALIRATREVAGTYRSRRGFFGSMKKHLHKEVFAAMESEDPPFIASLGKLLKDS